MSTPVNLAAASIHDGQAVALHGRCRAAHRRPVHGLAYEPVTYLDPRPRLSRVICAQFRTLPLANRGYPLVLDTQTTLLLHRMNGARSALENDDISAERVIAAVKQIVHHGLFDESELGTARSSQWRWDCSRTAAETRRGTRNPSAALRGIARGEDRWRSLTPAGHARDVGPAAPPKASQRP